MTRKIRIKSTTPWLIKLIFVFNCLLMLALNLWLIIDDVKKSSLLNDHPFFYFWIVCVCFQIIILFLLLMFSIFRKKFSIRNFGSFDFFYNVALFSNIFSSFSSLLFSINGDGNELWVYSLIMYCIVIITYFLIFYISYQKNKKLKNINNALMLQIINDASKNKEEYQKIYDIYNDIVRVKIDENKTVVEKAPIEIKVKDSTVAANVKEIDNVKKDSNEKEKY